MNQSLRILHLEDLPSDAELIERVLRKSSLVFERVLVDSKDAYLQALTLFKPDIVLSDHALPSYNSREALVHLKKAGVHIPFILITSTISEEFAVEIIKLGAADYILKDRMQRLPTAVNNALELNRLEKEKQQFIAEIITSERLMNEAEEMAHFGSLSINTATNTVRLSSEARRIFGFGKTDVEISSESFYGAIHPGDAGQVKNKMADVIAVGGNLQKCNYRIIDKTGAVRYIYSECRLAPAGEYTQATIKGFIRDITEKKVTENSLHKSEANLQTVFNNTDTAYVLFTPDQKIISFNSQANVFAKDLFGRHIKEGTPAADYFPGKRMLFINEMFGNAVRGENCAYETSQYNLEGVVKWYYSRWLGIADTENHNLGVILAISDITERKNADLEKEKISADLIQRNNALEQFAFIVSHNLRAPVANIIALSNLLTSQGNRF
jgi:PAS domain S-box-containing protein